MKRAAPFLLLLGLAMPLAARDANAEQLAFQLYAMGLPVAESRMIFNLAPASYHMELRYHTTGLVKLVSGDQLDQSSNGTFEHDEPVPTEFKSFVRLHAQDRIVTLEYRNGDPTIAAINPPNEAEREIVPPARRDHTLDPLSAMIDMLHVAARTPMTGVVWRCSKHERWVRRIFRIPAGRFSRGTPYAATIQANRSPG
jgi:hypothetical protein